MLKKFNQLYLCIKMLKSVPSSCVPTLSRNCCNSVALFGSLHVAITVASNSSNRFTKPNPIPRLAPVTTTYWCVKAGGTTLYSGMKTVLRLPNASDPTVSWKTKQQLNKKMKTNFQNIFCFLIRRYRNDISIF